MDTLQHPPGGTGSEEDARWLEVSALKSVNFIKARTMQSPLFQVLCDEMGSEHVQLLLHTELRSFLRANLGPGMTLPELTDVEKLLHEGNVYKDGARAMTGRHSGVAARIQEVAPEMRWTHCSIYREALAVKKMPDGLKSLL
ncbi:hypothetical protein JOQ06_009035 [Pogonophryne albipinna]|uniref:Uncharacterized protein n=1 Tax=Pogonophryne albipinna TaxID=1090488 RepID=A0AAD6FT47_9TELE|nr:hypothetical protein JOQ06_009035 [Pogonophryne albipinna]